MHLVLGGYDGSVIGLQLAAASGNGAQLVSRTRFAYAPHSSCVKTIASSGHTLVTTGTDERVLVYDIKRRTEYGTLLQHEGTVTCSEFWGGTHLLTGSEDKTVVIWDTKRWISLHTLRGFKHKVAALAVHPSGKLAIVADTTGLLHVWDLIAAKCVFKHRVEPCCTVRWSPDGEAYATAQGKKVVLSTVGAGDISTIECEDNVLDFAFVDEHTLAVGGDDKVVSLWDCQTAKARCIARGVPFPNRIKAVKAFRMGGVQYVAAATCEGTVAIYDMVSLQAAGAKAIKVTMHD